MNNGLFWYPFKGKKSDGAHPPIHPVKNSDISNLSDVEKSIY